MQRRTLLLAPLLLAVSDAVLARLKPTRSQAEGPYYPTSPIPLNNDLVNFAGGVASGERLALDGALLSEDGEPVAGALIEIWQCDASGIYRHPAAPGTANVDRHFAGAGATTSAADGRYRFDTLLPVPYASGARPPHIHLKVRSAHGRTLLVSQLYLKGQAREGSTFRNLFTGGGRSELAIDPVSNGETLEARFDIVVPAA